ncbi:MAG: vitamin K epoxide reductase family protein [Nanoarchaeota archaeon]|nr:vitamin K epoxide reductase family protein [Nanoarchaeota archaeon]
MKKSDKFILYVILVLGLIALGVSIYLTYNHFNADKGSFCDLGEVISCSLVNTSIFSELFNIPVALLGIFWSLFLMIFAWKALKRKEFYLALYGWSIMGIISVIYFVIAEIILKAICPFCTVIHVITLVVLILSYSLYKQNKPSWKSLKKYIGGWALLFILIMIITFFIFNVKTNPDMNLDDFAMCINDSGVKMYGSFRCGVCAKERALFGDSFDYINEIECHPDGENSQTALCLSKGVQGTPTWVLESEGEELDRHIGYMDLEELAYFSGCEL